MLKETGNRPTISIKDRSIIKASLEEEDSEALFDRARETVGESGIGFCSTITLDRACALSSPCLHCRWGHLPPEWRSAGGMAEQADPVARARLIERSGAGRVILVSGWKGERLPQSFFQVIERIKADTSLEVFGGFGYVSQETLGKLKSAGMDGYRCGLELASTTLFRRVRPGDDFYARMATTRIARDMGFKTWSGFMFGAGESIEDIAESLELLKLLGVDIVHIDPLVPLPYTALEAWDPPNLMSWARTIAAARLYLKTVEIVTRPEHVEWAFRAGANGFIRVEPDPAEMKRLSELAGMVRRMRERCGKEEPEVVGKGGELHDRG